MKLNASAPVTHTPAGTVSATPALKLFRRPQVHTQPVIQPFPWLAGRRGDLCRDHAGETRKTAPRPLLVLLFITLFGLSISRALIVVFFPF